MAAVLGPGGGEEGVHSAQYNTVEPSPQPQSPERATVYSSII
jgi:hypothetical protein